MKTREYPAFIVGGLILVAGVAVLAIFATGLDKVLF